MNRPGVRERESHKPRRDACMLLDFATTAESVEATTRKSEKETILAGWLRTLDDFSLERAVVFFSGSPFPRRDARASGVGWAAILDAVESVTGVARPELAVAARRLGDLGDAVGEVFAGRASDGMTVAGLGEQFDHLAAVRGAAKGEALAAIYARLGPAEARFVTKILLGDLRIGLQEGLVEAAIAKAFGAKLADVRRAHMFTGDLGATALRAKSGALDTVRMTLFHPVGFMLAQAEEDPEAIVEQTGAGAVADDKYDGIRAQVHASGGEVRIYSRTLDEVSHRFPEIVAAARSLPGEVLLDGEIVAFDGRILPFAVLQKRLGRRTVSDALLEAAPAAFFAFDILYRNSVPLFDVPLAERLDHLDRVTSEAAAPIIRGFQRVVVDGADVDAAFDAARARGNEGLVVKAIDSLYTPGRRGKSWLKYKKALATLDCVVTAAEYGHGKRRDVLSDYTFAVRSDDRLLNIGKAYSGLTDIEIAKLTAHFMETTIERHGPVHVVEPTVVLEIAFDRIQESKRHRSGYALRFPRIARIRDDKSVEEISTLDEVRRVYEGQFGVGDR